MYFYALRNVCIEDIGQKIALCYQELGQHNIYNKLLFQFSVTSLYFFPPSPFWNICLYESRCMQTNDRIIIMLARNVTFERKPKDLMLSRKVKVLLQSASLTKISWRSVYTKWENATQFNEDETFSLQRQVKNCYDVNLYKSRHALNIMVILVSTEAVMCGLMLLLVAVWSTPAGVGGPRGRRSWHTLNRTPETLTSCHCFIGE